LLMNPRCTSSSSPAKSHRHSTCRARSTTTISWTVASSLSAFRPRGSLDRRVNCHCVPQPRWVGARRSAKGGESWRETGVKGETHDLRVCPAPRSGALAVGGYKRPREREREAYARAVPSFPARPTLCKRALDLPFIGVRRGSRCTMGDVAVC
jgi:hypothetical protein